MQYAPECEVIPIKLFNFESKESSLKVCPDHCPTTIEMNPDGGEVYYYIFNGQTIILYGFSIYR